MMATYLLLWNPTDWPYADLVRMLKRMGTSADGLVREDWRFMSNRKGKAGDEVFLFKSHKNPRGIFGHGTLEGKWFWGPGSDHKEHKMFRVAFDELVDPMEKLLVSERALLKIPGWSTQRGSGNYPLDANVAKRLHKLLGARDHPFNKQTVRLLEDGLSSLTATERDQIVTQRIGQDIFRDNMLRYWNGRCCISGISQPELLRASHIRSWAQCETTEQRLDVYNGLLLNAHLDAAFDAGLFTLNDNGVVQVSGKLPIETTRILGIDKAIKVSGISHRHKRYLNWHRVNRFRPK